ncbi:MAG: long-chain fatty acid--CoA ligase [Spirochaetaceae bacterium]|nr:MAG: long-chain fatty acid--CoA ligase [Spirochaetaceae bacterium]
MRMTKELPWSFLDAYRDESAGSLRLTERWPSLPHLFAISASRYPDRNAFSCYDPKELRFTYAQAFDAVYKTALELAKRGVLPGDRVVVTGKNSPEWAIAYLAVLARRAVVVPLDFQLTDAEIKNLVSISEAKTAFVDHEKLKTFASLGTNTIALAEGDPDYILDLVRSDSNTTALHDPAQGFEDGFPAAGDSAAIMFTSGTTGAAKGVTLTHENFVSDCLLAQSLLQVRHTDVFYALLPIHHSYTMLAVFIEAISVGAEVVFAKKLVVQQILSDLKTAQVTMFLGVPTLFNRLLKGIMRGVREKGPVVYGIIRFLMISSGMVKKATGMNPGKRIFKGILAKASLDSIRICISGGGPLPSETFRRFNQLGIDFVQGYGLTETAPILTLNPVAHYKESSVGKVLPEVEMKIIDPDERGRGEIVVRGPMVMQGYYNNPKATEETIDKEGFLHTGDIGYLDSENYLYLTGRKKSLIVTSAGKNVYPEELESHFDLFDEVAQVMVAGYVSDPEEHTEDIEAFIHPDTTFFESKDGNTDKEAAEARIREIISQVNKGLQPYQRIRRSTVLWEPMETTTTRKIKRHVVQKHMDQ